MTEVSFHVRVADPLAHACRLVRKAWSTGAQVVVTAEPAVLRDLDTSLWTFAEREFLPHCMAGAVPPHVQARTPVVLAADPLAAGHRQVLVNLAPKVPEGFERFERLIEVVGSDAETHAEGRRRYRHYKDRGYELKHHDFSEPRA